VEAEVVVLTAVAAAIANRVAHISHLLANVGLQCYPPLRCLGVGIAYAVAFADRQKVKAGGYEKPHPA